MSKEEIEEVLNEQNICRIAFYDEEYPYISPFQYVILDNILYFHFTEYGKKMDILEKNRNVCVSIEKFASDLSDFYFISLQGSLMPIKNKIEKYKVVDKMVEKLRKKYSTNFLVTNGIDREKGWEGFKRSEPLIIYYLDEKKSRVALKSKY